MCKAFSGIIKENGEVLWQFGMDSHEDIIQKFGLRDTESPPTFARFEVAPKNGEYLDPDEWVFRLDEKAKPKWWKDIYKDWACAAKDEWQKKLDKILVHKPIVHPFKIDPPKKITKKHLDLLRSWASVGDSVRASVWDSVWASVGASVGDSVGASVRASVWASVGDSVRASVGDSVWDSVWDSVGAYSGSFFRLPRESWKYTEKIKTTGYPFQPAVDLWEMGLVPSFRREDSGGFMVGRMLKSFGKEKSNDPK